MPSLQNSLGAAGIWVFSVPRPVLVGRGQYRLRQSFRGVRIRALPLANQVRHRDGTLGEMAAIDSEWMKINRGNEAWHTDSTYRPISSKVAMLSAVKLPSAGGQTNLPICEQVMRRS